MKHLLEKTLNLFNKFSKSKYLILSNYELDFILLKSGLKSLRIYDCRTNGVGYIYLNKDHALYQLNGLIGIKPLLNKLRLDLSILDEYDETEWILSNGRYEYKDEMLSLINHILDEM